MWEGTSKYFQAFVYHLHLLSSITGSREERKETNEQPRTKKQKIPPPPPLPKGHSSWWHRFICLLIRVQYLRGRSYCFSWDFVLMFREHT